MQIDLRYRRRLTRLTVSACFLALAMILPFLTGQIPEIGNMLCPMHLPVMLCGYLCGPIWGLTVGAVAPFLRFALFRAPEIMPRGIAMAVELATYGCVIGLLRPLYTKNLGINVLSHYLTLIGAMVSGRLTWGFAQYLLAGLNGSSFPVEAFWVRGVLNALPGIVLQLILFPLLAPLLERLPVVRVLRHRPSLNQPKKRSTL